MTRRPTSNSQRTYNNSVPASPAVSQTIIDKPLGHAPKATGVRCEICANGGS